MGFSKGMLGQIEGWAPPGSVVVIEEPDIFRKKQVDAVWRRYSCIDEIVQARYHQSEDFLAPALERHARLAFECVIPCVEYPLPAAAVVAERSGLMGASEAAALA